ncbi:MAG: putative porin [Bacteroidaceae bacterium]|nr:putative porin [Bacteroidaceae bacterium]
MKRFLLINVLLIFGWAASMAQVTKVNQYGEDQNGNQIDPTTHANKLDSTDTEIQSLPPKLYMWHLSKELGNRTIVPIDTLSHQFQNANLNEGMDGSYNHLGNMGSPRLSRIFFERNDNGPTLFLNPFSFFIYRPSQIFFTNSNIPYTNITYHKAGDKLTGEEHFRSYFSVNVNKRAAFGFTTDYLYGRGQYNSQSTAYFNGTLFGSYIGDRYEFQGIYSQNYMKNNENGGITDDRYITDPEAISGNKKTIEATNIPTVLDETTNRNKNAFLHLTQRYNIGFRRLVKETKNDSVPSKQKNDTIPPKTEYVPVTSFIHTIHIERTSHKFTSKDSVSNYYANDYLNTDTTAVRDTTVCFSIKNTFGIKLLEGFNKYAKAGLTAFISHKYSSYTLMGEEGKGEVRNTEQEVYLGGELSKRQGNVLHYHVLGKTGMAGKAIGQFFLNGDININFPLFKDTVRFVARGAISNTLAPYYMRHYHSKHFWWDDNMNKMFRTRFDGDLSIENWGTELQAGVENIKNYTYFNAASLPEQNSGNIQVLSAKLNQNFRFGVLHLDNEITWQKSSNQTVLPLPNLSLYHNLYLQVKLAKKVLSLELGADVKYFSEYYAPGYTPALSQFRLQDSSDKVKIGGYPIIDVYANFHLKRTRFYLMMYHVNCGSGTMHYFLAPHYPINPRMLKFGLSWNFFD